MKELTTIRIRTPYYGAGTVMGWDKEKYGIVGIGLAKTKLDRAQGLTKIKLASDDSTWRVHAEELVEWAKEHNSIDDRKGAKLYVVPVQLLNSIHAPYSSDELMRMAR